jgi:hypothetical protein
MIDPAELRQWLLAGIANEDIDAPEPIARHFCRGRVDAYVRVGERFGALKSNDPDVRPLLPTD